MSPPFAASDLEAGPSRTGITEARSPLSVVDLAPQQEKSVGTKAIMTRGRDQPRAQPRTPKDENMFAGDAGQSLLLAFDSHRDREALAILVPVFRPSIDWAHRMAILEKNQKPLPVKPPATADFHIDRWRQFRWLHRGEDEIDIWERIKRQYLAQQPRWYPFLPFWRPVMVEERNASFPHKSELLLHGRESAVYKVEIEPAIDLQEEREKADRRLRQANEKLEGYMPEGYSCHGDFDAFGDFYSKFHDVPPCRGGFDYGDCDIEIFIRCKSERDRLERKHDFMGCFTDPTKASTVYPLTVGRVLGTCIHDNNTIRNCPLPSREHPNRLPHRINGLVIKYHFRSTRIELEFLASSLFVGAVVLIWRLATGDWNVAAALGSLCVALMALGHQRSRTTAGTAVKNTKVD